MLFEFFQKEYIDYVCLESAILNQEQRLEAENGLKSYKNILMSLLNGAGPHATENFCKQLMDGIDEYVTNNRDEPLSKWHQEQIDNLVSIVGQVSLSLPLKNIDGEYPFESYNLKYDTLLENIKHYLKEETSELLASKITQLS